MSLEEPVVRDSMSQALDKVSRLVSGLSILLSVAIIVCGILAILLPVEMSQGVVIVIAWLLMISGVVQVIHAIRGKTTGSRQWAGLSESFTSAWVCFSVSTWESASRHLRLR